MFLVFFGTFDWLPDGKKILQNLSCTYSVTEIYLRTKIVKNFNYRFRSLQGSVASLHYSIKWILTYRFENNYLFVTFERNLYKKIIKLYYYYYK